MNEGLLRRIWKARKWYMFVLPAIVYFMVFKYYPLYYIQIAFRDFRMTRPLESSPFVGFKYFQELFNSPGFWSAVENTLIINSYKLVICFPASIILAILINELRFKFFKKSIQTVLYLPHFISWIVVASILTNLLTVDGGLINDVINYFGGESIMFLGKQEYFRSILVLSELWKEVGYGAIIYLAALASIDPQLYEAAEIDGANWLQRMYHISLVGIKEVIAIMLLLRIGFMLAGNFDQIQALLNQQVIPVGDIMDTYIYRVGIANSRYSFAAAAGLLNTLVAAILLFGADRIAKRLGERGIF